MNAIYRFSYGECLKGNSLFLPNPNASLLSNDDLFAGHHNPLPKLITNHPHCVQAIELSQQSTMVQELSVSDLVYRNLNMISSDGFCNEEMTMHGPKRLRSSSQPRNSRCSSLSPHSSVLLHHNEQYSTTCRVLDSWEVLKRTGKDYDQKTGSLLFLR